MQTLFKFGLLLLLTVLGALGCSVKDGDGADAGVDVNGQSDGPVADRPGTTGDGAASADGSPESDGSPAADGARADTGPSSDGGAGTDRGPETDGQSDTGNPDVGSGMDVSAEAGTDATIDTGATPDGSDDGTMPPTNPLRIEVVVAADPVVPSGRLLYGITVGNISQRAVDDVRVLLRVPAGVEVHTSGDSEPDPTTLCGNVLCTADKEVGWALGTMAAGATTNIAINAQVLATVNNGDAISALFTLSGTNVQQLLLTKTVHVNAQPVVELVMATERNLLAPGETAHLDIDFGQIGTTALSGTEVRATIPAGLTIGTISNGGTVASNGDVVWTIGDLGVGAMLHRSVNVTLATGTAFGTPLTSRTVLLHGGGTVGAASECTLQAVNAPSPLQLDMGVVNDTVAPGERVAYVLTVSNQSARAIDGVALVWRMPREVSFNTSADAEPDVSCSNAACAQHYEARWPLGTLAAGTSRSIFFNAVAATTLIDGSLITARARLASADLTSLTAVKTNHVASQPAAKIALAPTKNPVRAGETFSFVVDLGQLGATALAGAELKTFLPAGLTVGTISDSGSQTAAGEITWPLGTIAVGSALRRTVSVTVDGTVPAGKFLQARALLKYAGNTDLGWQAERGVTVVADPSPLEWNMTATPSPGAPGGRVLYTMTLRNASARDVTGINVWLRIPEAMQFHAASDADPDITSGGCNGNANCVPHREAVWSIATLAAGLTQTITVNPLITAGTLDGKLMIAPTMVSATGMIQNVEAQLVVPVHQ